MDVAALFVELFDRLPPLAAGAIRGVDNEQLVRPPAPGANTIAWLLWHTARIQDHHVSDLVDAQQVWVTGDWAPRVGLAPDPSNTGYGHQPEDVLAVRPERPGVLLEYLDAVYRRTRPLLEGLAAGDLDRVVDRRWDPPVTLGVRLVSVANDGLQHLGQAAYVQGLLGVGD